VPLAHVTAALWSAFGGFLAYLILFLLPELLRQRKEERDTGVPFSWTGLGVTIFVVLLVVAIGCSVGVALVLEPYKLGDAWLDGLGSISFVSGVLGLTNLGLKLD
jgi:hypothetical protein